MEGTVIAAIISGGVATVIAANAVITKQSYEKERKRNTEELAKLQAALSLENNKLLGEHQKLFDLLADEQAQNRDRRRDALVAVFNATSIANSAAQHLLTGAAVKNPERRLYETAQAMQKLSKFFSEAQKAEENIRLNKHDVEQVIGVRTALVRLFLALDLDAESSDYENRLRDAHGVFNNAFAMFQDYVRKAANA